MSGDCNLTVITVTVAGVGAFATTTVVPLDFPNDAVIAAVPGDTAVTVPLGATVSTVSSLEDHVAGAAVETTLPAESTRVAVACVVSPTGIVDAATDSATVGAAGSTGFADAIVTATVPDFPSANAPMLTVPGVTPLTTPIAETDAMNGLLVVHDTWRSSNTFPAESLTVALARADCPACSVVESIVITTVATVGGSDAVTVTVAVADFPRSEALTIAVPGDPAVTIPDDETAATDGFELFHTTLALELLKAFPA